MEDDLFEIPNRTHEEKLKALIVDDHFPVAVLNLDILSAEIGQWTTIPGISPADAIRISKITNPVLAKYTDENSHIWVNPSYKSYKNAWKKAGFKVPINKSRQLDHLHAKNQALRQGYGYVLLLDVSSGPNMSAGSHEKRNALQAMPGYALSNPIHYATEIHWAKLWDLNQLKAGELTKETFGK